MRKNIYQEKQWLLFPLLFVVLSLSATLVAANASAAVVESSYIKHAGYDSPSEHGSSQWVVVYSHTVSYRSSAGESNDLTISRDSDGRTRIIDPGAVIQAGFGCQLLNEHEAMCSTVTPIAGESATNYVEAKVNLEDGNDRASLAVGATVDAGDGNDTLSLAEGSTVDGGAGNDVVSLAVGSTVDGGAGNDVIFGSRGDDSLKGGPGSDELYGGQGDDSLNGYDGETPEKDILDGNDGTDYASYANSLQSVSVDLGVQSAGGVGEGDVLRSLENAAGGMANDILVGSSGNNNLEGGGGDDNLSGGGGNDYLEGGNGADTLNGESDNDTLDGDDGLDTLNGGEGGDELYGGKRERSLKQDLFADILNAGPDNDIVHLSTVGEVAHCGFGVDIVASPIKGSVIGLDCDRVDFFEPFIAPKFQLPLNVASGKRAVSVTIPCEYEAQHHRRCPGKLTVRVGTLGSKSVKIASRKFSVRVGDSAVRITVPAGMRKMLRPEVPLSIHVELNDFSNQHNGKVPKETFDFTAFAQYTNTK